MTSQTSMIGSEVGSGPILYAVEILCNIQIIFTLNDMELHLSQNENIFTLTRMKTLIICILIVTPK